MRERKGAMALTPKRSEDIRQMEREACRTVCRTVLSAYAELRCSLGSVSAMDYSSETGGQSAQYAPNDPYRNVDYIVDCENVMRHSLSLAERNRYSADLLETDRTNTSADLLEVEARLGREFARCGLRPVDYFRIVRRALPRDRI